MPESVLAGSGAAAWPGSYVEWAGLPDSFDFQLDTDYSVTDFHLFNHGASGGAFGAKDFTLRFYDNVGTQVGSFSGVAAAGTDLVSAPNDFSFPAISPVRRVEFEVTTGLSGLRTAINQVTWEGVAQPVTYVDYHELITVGGFTVAPSPLWQGFHKSGFGGPTVWVPPAAPFCALAFGSPLVPLPQSPAQHLDLGNFIDNGAGVGESTLALAVRHTISGATPDLAIEFAGNRDRSEPV